MLHDNKRGDWRRCRVECNCKRFHCRFSVGVLKMALTLVSLDAVTVTGPGAVLSFHEPKSNVSMQVIVTGSPTESVTDLQGSLDGVNFFGMCSVLTGSPSCAFAGFPILHLRASLRTLSGGSAPTVTAIIAAGG